MFVFYCPLIASATVSSSQFVAASSMTGALLGGPIRNIPYIKFLVAALVALKLLVNRKISKK